MLKGDLCKACAALKVRVEELQKSADLLVREAQHWKANHDNMVARSRVLMERPDLPLERVEAFKLIGELQRRVDQLPLGE